MHERSMDRRLRRGRNRSRRRAALRPRRAQTYAVFRSAEDEFFATAGLCTHEKIHLADGLVMDHVIECPKHNGRFDYTALARPWARRSASI